LLHVTAGNLRQNHLYINGHYDFFPDDYIGPSRKSTNSTSREIEIVLEGLKETVKTGRTPTNPSVDRFAQNT